jgi:hypothetical protein
MATKIDTKALLAAVEAMIAAAESGNYGSMCDQRDILFETLSPDNPGRGPENIEALEIDDDDKLALEELLTFTRAGAYPFQGQKRKGLKLLRGAIDVLKKPLTKRVKPKPNAARDKRIYGWKKSGKTGEQILNLIRKTAAFEPVETVQAVTVAAKRWAIRNKQPWPLSY